MFYSHCAVQKKKRTSPKRLDLALLDLLYCFLLAFRHRAG